MGDEHIHGCWVTGANRTCEDGTKWCARRHPLRMKRIARIQAGRDVYREISETGQLRRYVPPDMAEQMINVPVTLNTALRPDELRLFGEDGLPWSVDE